MGHGRLAPGRGVHLIIEHEMEQVGRPLVTDRRQGAETHERRPVAIQHDDAPPRLIPGQAKPKARSTAH